MSWPMVLQKLHELRLPGMEQTLERLITQPDAADLPLQDTLTLLLDGEQHFRTQRKQTRLMKNARLKNALACPEDIDYRSARGLTRPQIAHLLSNDWIHRKQHLIVTGPTGVGKTWLACAFGNNAIRHEMSTLYKRFSLLMETLAMAQRDGSLPSVRNQLSKPALLIIDDWAMSPMTDVGRQQLFELVDARLDNGSLLITSQLPVSQWYEYLGEPTLADAIMDRIVHRAHTLVLKGESMRKQDKPEEKSS